MRACEVVRRGVRSGRGWLWLGRRGEGDAVTEDLDLVDEVAGASLAVNRAWVEVGAEVVEAGGRVGEQVQDNDQDRAGDRDDRFEFAAAFDQPPVALAEEGPCWARCHCRVSKPASSPSAVSR